MTCVVSGLLTAPAATRTGYRDGRASGGRDTAAGRRRSRHVAPAPDGQDTRRFDLDAGTPGLDPDSECPAHDGPVVSRVHDGRRLSGQAVGSRPRRVARGRHRSPRMIGCGIDMSTSNGVTLAGTAGLNASQRITDVVTPLPRGILPGVEDRIGRVVARPQRASAGIPGREQNSHRVHDRANGLLGYWPLALVSFWERPLGWPP